MWRRVVTFLQHFFSLSPKEARGMLVLVLISAMALVFPFFLKHYLLARSPEEIALERRFLDSLMKEVFLQKEVVSRTAVGQPVKEPKQSILVSFDPNIASESELIALGIPTFLARRIVNFRNKGGVFRSKTDLKRIYDFPPDLYQKLEPYILLRQVAARQEEKAFNTLDNRGTYQSEVGQVVPEKTGKNTAAKYSSDGPSIVAPFDINRADTIQLKRLKGIGSARARIIINYRNSLGGFHSVSQYREIYTLDSVSITQLNSFGRILSPHKKISINEVSLDELMKHPYARKNKKMTEAIIRYRTQHGAFKNLEDLKKVVVVSSEFLDLMTPYLAF